MLISGVMSWCGLSYQRRHVFLVLSAYLILPLGLGELSLGVLCLVKKDDLVRFMKDHQAQLDVSDDWITRFEAYNVVAAAVLFGLFVLSVFRYMSSKQLSGSVARHLEQRAENEAKQETAERQRDLERSLLVKNKYDGLKQQYRAKFDRPSGSGMGYSSLPEQTGSSFHGV